jgi:hypothetical protein
LLMCPHNMHWFSCPFISIYYLKKQIKTYHTKVLSSWIDCLFRIKISHFLGLYYKSPKFPQLNFLCKKLKCRFFKSTNNTISRSSPSFEGGRELILTPHCPLPSNEIILFSKSPSCYKNCLCQLWSVITQKASTTTPVSSYKLQKLNVNTDQSFPCLFIHLQLVRSV